MAEPNGSVSVKDLLALMREEAKDRFDRIEALLDRKASEAEVQALDARLTTIERTHMTPLVVEDQIAKALQSAKARGWSTKERSMAMALFAFAAINVLVSVLQIVKQ